MPDDWRQITTIEVLGWHLAHLETLLEQLRDSLGSATVAINDLRTALEPPDGDA